MQRKIYELVKSATLSVTQLVECRPGVTKTYVRVLSDQRHFSLCLIFVLVSKGYFIEENHGKDSQTYHTLFYVGTKQFLDFVLYVTKVFNLDVSENCPSYRYCSNFLR